MLAAGCGGDNGAAPTAATTGSPTTAATRSQANLTATGSIPDVDGYERSVAEKVVAPAGLDIATSLFRKKGTTDVAARLEVRVYKDEATAKSDMAAQALGWKSPPPGLFGSNITNNDSAPLMAFAEATAYRAQAADAQGNRVYTDVYRVGRVIVVQHVLSKSDPEATVLRKAVSDAVQGKVG